MSFEDRTQRCGDVRRGETSGGDLVEKRLEQMEVAAIDEGDANRGSAERLRGVEAAKAAADDDDVWQQRQLSSKGIASSSSMMGMSSRIG